MRVSTPLAFVALACVLALASALPTSLRGRAYTQRATADLDPRGTVSVPVLLGGRRGRAARFQARSFRVEGAKGAEADEEESGRRAHADADAELEMRMNLLSHQQMAPSLPSATTAPSPPPFTPVPVLVPVSTSLTPAPQPAAHHKKTKTKQGSGGHKKAVPVHHVSVE